MLQWTPPLIVGASFAEETFPEGKISWMPGDKILRTVLWSGKWKEWMALMTSQRARPEKCKNTIFHFDGESDKKQEKCFIVILYGNFAFFDKSSLSPKLHRARWVVLSAAFCFWSFLTKARDVLKWKVQVIHIIRYKAWDWSRAVLSAMVHIKRVSCTQ